ncbi:MAG: nuclear transport factor 2 family protein [Acidobacteria bacterium]|nr:nuclear transport factor 2 family protein [Acidobacteriota bacterium]MBI3470942.1 nuclear transport factor 2 family protein [Candidatus Solibacter usitatus]
MKRSVVRILLIAAAAVASFAASGEEEIRGAEKAWAAAVKGRDFAALDKIFTPGLIYAHATGSIESKEKYIDRLRSGAQRYDSITHEDVRVVMYGDAAVAHSMVRVTGSNNAGPFNDHVMMMHLWVKQGGAWRLAAHQTTKVP